MKEKRGKNVIEKEKYKREEGNKQTNKHGNYDLGVDLSADDEKTHIICVYVSVEIKYMYM